jgi:hypothetical protein
MFDQRKLEDKMKQKRPLMNVFSLTELETIKISLNASRIEWKTRLDRILKHENPDDRLVGVCNRRIDEIDSILKKINPQIDFLIIEDCK